MTRQSNRLPADGHHRFKGTSIDRERPLRFRLDGLEIHGFSGDTLLSAVIASGVVGAGTRHGRPLALDERLAPAVLLRGAGRGPATALPMERTPAIDGLELVSLPRARHGGHRDLLDRALAQLPGRRRSLGHRFEGDRGQALPWLDLQPGPRLEAGLAVIGGGLAGMAAAIAGARRGLRVVLIERQQPLGGNARFFGGTERDDPEAMVTAMAETIAGLSNIVVLRQAEAFALSEGIVRVSQVIVENGLPASRVLVVAAPRIVLSTGIVERLPVFPGNRRPGVVGALAAFDRAARFGVWIGRTALLTTATSVAYRLATQARDAGIEVERIADSRLDAQSRFIEFSKAYGVPLMRATRPLLATGSRRGAEIPRVVVGSKFRGDSEAGNEFTVDQFVVAGGWQPDLRLWCMAGGAIRFNPEAGRLEARGRLAGIALAGAAVGHRNGSACQQSGEAAVSELFGEPVGEIDDPQIDPLYESPDDVTPIAPLDPRAAEDTYLDGGHSFLRRPAAPKGWWPYWRVGTAVLGENFQPLGVAEIAAAVQLGSIPAAEAPLLAQERAVPQDDIVAAGQRLPPFGAPARDGLPPPYLSGRFGINARPWIVEPADGRRFETGCLVYASADTADPLTAIGVVFAPAPGEGSGGLALIGKGQSAAGDALSVRDISGPVAVRLVDPEARRRAKADVAAAAEPPPRPTGAPATALGNLPVAAATRRTENASRAADAHADPDESAPAGGTTAGQPGDEDAPLADAGDGPIMLAAAAGEPPRPVEEPESG